MHFGNRNYVGGTVESVFSFSGNHNWGSFVGPKDGDFFGHIVGR